MLSEGMVRGWRRRRLEAAVPATESGWGSWWAAMVPDPAEVRTVDLRPGLPLSVAERGDLLRTLPTVLPPMSRCRDLRLTLDSPLTPPEFELLARRVLVPLAGGLRTLHLACDPDEAGVAAYALVRDAHLLGAGDLRALRLELSSPWAWSSSAAAACLTALLVPPSSPETVARGRLVQLELTFRNLWTEHDGLASAVSTAVKTWAASLVDLRLHLENCQVGPSGATLLALLPLVLSTHRDRHPPLRRWSLRLVNGIWPRRAPANGSEQEVCRGWGTLARCALRAARGLLDQLRHLELHLDVPLSGAYASDLLEAAGDRETPSAEGVPTDDWVPPLRSLSIRWPNVLSDDEPEGLSTTSPPPPDLAVRLVRRLACAYPGLERLSLSNLPCDGGRGSAARTPPPALAHCRELDLEVSVDEGWTEALLAAAGGVERLRLRFPSSPEVPDAAAAMVLRTRLDVVGALPACRRLAVEGSTPRGGDWVRWLVGPGRLPALEALRVESPNLCWDAEEDPTWGVDALVGANRLRDVTLVVRVAQRGGDRTRAPAAALRPLLAALGAPALRTLDWRLEGGVGDRGNVAAAVAAAVASPVWAAATGLARLHLEVARAPVTAADLSGLLCLGVRQLQALRDLTVRVGVGTRIVDEADVRALETVLAWVVPPDGHARAWVVLGQSANAQAPTPLVGMVLRSPRVERRGGVESILQG